MGDEVSDVLDSVFEDSSFEMLEVEDVLLTRGESGAVLEDRVHGAFLVLNSVKYEKQCLNTGFV